MKRAAVYCRISQDRADTELGVDRQEKLCRALAKKKGWKVEKVFTDNDISAMSKKKRDEFEAMAEALCDGSVDAIVCYHPDRLTKKPRELEDLIDLLNENNVADRSRPSTRAEANRQVPSRERKATRRTVPSRAGATTSRARWADRRTTEDTKSELEFARPRVKC